MSLVMGAGVVVAAAAAALAKSAPNPPSYPVDIIRQTCAWTRAARQLASARQLLHRVADWFITEVVLKSIPWYGISGRFLV